MDPRFVGRLPNAPDRPGGNCPLPIMLKNACALRSVIIVGGWLPGLPPPACCMLPIIFPIACTSFGSNVVPSPASVPRLDSPVGRLARETFGIFPIVPFDAIIAARYSFAVDGWDLIAPSGASNGDGAGP